MFSELRFRKVQRFTQTVLTFPHFLSWVVLAGIIFNVFSTTGVVNNIIFALGFKPVNFLMNAGTFRGLLVATNVWKESGWDSIIFLAAIMGVDQSSTRRRDRRPSRLRQIWHITFPSILSIIVVISSLESVR
jgi:putative aldouronate transport system permease protein